MSEAGLRILTPFILVVVGIIIETKYVPRVVMFTNAAALYIFYHSINMPPGLGLIVNLAIIIGLIAGVSRILNIPLISLFYDIAWIASSVVTGFLLLIGLRL